MKNKAHHNIKVAFWAMIIISIIAFGAILTMLHGTIYSIDRDPALATLTADGMAKFVQIKNLNEDFSPEPGLYIIITDGQQMRLEGPQEDLFNKDIFLLKEDYVRQTLGGFMMENKKYYRKITVSYPQSEDLMQVEVETQDDEKQSYYQSIKLNK